MEGITTRNSPYLAGGRIFGDGSPPYYFECLTWVNILKRKEDVEFEEDFICFHCSSLGTSIRGKGG